MPGCDRPVPVTASVNLGISSEDIRNVLVHAPASQRLMTRIPVSAYQLRRMRRLDPRTSKKTSPSLGKEARGARVESACPPSFLVLLSSPGVSAPVSLGISCVGKRKEPVSISP